MNGYFEVSVIKYVEKELSLDLEKLGRKQFRI